MTKHSQLILLVGIVTSLLYSSCHNINSLGIPLKKIQLITRSALIGGEKFEQMIVILQGSSKRVEEINKKMNRAEKIAAEISGLNIGTENPSKKQVSDHSSLSELEPAERAIVDKEFRTLADQIKLLKILPEQKLESASKSIFNDVHVRQALAVVSCCSLYESADVKGVKLQFGGALYAKGAGENGLWGWRVDIPHSREPEKGIAQLTLNKTSYAYRILDERVANEAPGEVELLGVYHVNLIRAALLGSIIKDFAKLDALMVIERLPDFEGHLLVTDDKKKSGFPKERDLYTTSGMFESRLPFDARVIK